MRPYELLKAARERCAFSHLVHLCDDCGHPDEIRAFIEVVLATGKQWLAEEAERTAANERAETARYQAQLKRDAERKAQQEHQDAERIASTPEALKAANAALVKRVEALEAKRARKAGTEFMS